MRVGAGRGRLDPKGRGVVECVGCGRRLAFARLDEDYTFGYDQSELRRAAGLD
jgi:hypothetical protein